MKDKSHLYFGKVNVTTVSIFHLACGIGSIKIVKLLLKSDAKRMAEMENSIFFNGVKLYLSSNKPKKKNQ